MGPESQGSGTDNAATTTSRTQEDNAGEASTAWEALRMTINYGKEYIDDMPLVGEPGSFRFSKNKDATVTSGQTKTQAQPSFSSAGTPGSRAASVVAPSSSTPPKGGKAADRATAGPEGALKGKPRKSKLDGASP